MSRKIILASVLVFLAGLQARAQSPFPRDLLPTRTALARLGLERQWMAVVPLTADERLLGISLSQDLFFAQTNKAFFHVFNAESGQLLWSVRLGESAARALPASVNSFAVFATNMHKLYALDRRTGRTIWVHDMGVLPSSPTSCDEDRVMVGLDTGKVYGYDLKIKTEKTTTLADHPIEAWNWQTGGPMKTKPLPAMKLAAFGSDDGKVYVAMSEERTMLYRIATGGPIGAGLGAFGTRLLVIPSADRNLYGVDFFTADSKWTFPSGAPIAQEPLVADNQIFVVNTAGILSSIDPNNGTPLWSTSTHGGRFLSVGAKRVYLESADNDLLVVDRQSGQTVADPQATLGRIGLNLREFQYAPMNRENDRLYFATSSGMIIGIREIGQTNPRLLRDPKALPFGYIPKEGISLTPPRPQQVEESAPPAGEEKEKPPGGEDNEKPPGGADAEVPK